MTTKECNNNVCISGRVISKELEFSHKVFGEKFYVFDLEVKRLSENKDIIPIVISERELYFTKIKENVCVYIEGRFRSYSKHEKSKSRLILDVFVEELYFIDEQDVDTNSITLHGFVCKEVIYRKTPLGREITDLVLAVNRPYGKTDYIPCITWGRNARFASTFVVGDEIQISGRIQSREYLKTVEEGTKEKRIAYEVSALEIEKV